jgi:hypothetical protein
MIKRKNGYQLSVVAIVAIVLLGCGGKKTPAPLPQKTTTTQNKPQQSSQPQAPSGMKLADLKGAGVVTGLGLKGNAQYKENEPIQFIVDTGDAEGYLYIVYLDNTGKTALLYPNEKSPLSELGGAYLFPRDFGGMDIRATKDCAGCKEDKTTVYALLSKEPIVDIKKITKNELLSFAPSSQSKAQGKGLKMDLSDAGPAANLNVGVIEFVVK